MGMKYYRKRIKPHDYIRIHVMCNNIFRIYGNRKMSLCAFVITKKPPEMLMVYYDNKTAREVCFNARIKL